MQIQKLVLDFFKVNFDRKGFDIKMKVLSIDASSKSTGVAIFEDEKLIGYKNIIAEGGDAYARILHMTNVIAEIYDKFKPDKVVLEDVLPADCGHSMQTFKVLHYLQANLVLMFYQKKQKVDLVIASSWRKICGIHTGAGVKRNSLKMADVKFVKDNYNIDVNDDIADAICIGHAYISEQRYTARAF